jgi:hypothetical protein
MKRIFGALILLSLAACDVPLREATCSCFDGAGNATANCDFDPLPNDPAINRAAFTLSTQSGPC